jgi:hypothetical protein|tara:strand:- start:161 stop:370 length:210 start_codon:yes stop_codon:yes gene_type:complete
MEDYDNFAESIETMTTDEIRIDLKEIAIEYKGLDVERARLEEEGELLVQALIDRGEMDAQLLRKVHEIC